MDWLGVSVDTIERTMALKQSKLQELLTWLPKLFTLKRGEEGAAAESPRKFSLGVSSN